MRRKQKNKKIIVIAIVLLLLISIGYAALSTTLTINGTANIAATSWNVHFANVQVKEGSVAVNDGTTAPAVAEGNTTTTELTYAVTLKKPGDFYEFNVDVVNSGSIDAMVSTETASIVTSSLTEAQQKYLDYTIKYVNGAEIEKNDKLKAGETKTITVKLLFKQDVNPEELPATEQTGITLTYTTNYVQADSSAIPKETSKKLIQITINFLNSSEFLTTNQMVIKAEEGMTVEQWFNSSYRVESDELLKTITVPDMDPFYWHMSGGDCYIVSNGYGSTWHGEQNRLYGDDLLTDGLEITWEIISGE